MSAMTRTYGREGPRKGGKRDIYRDAPQFKILRTDRHSSQMGSCIIENFSFQSTTTTIQENFESCDRTKQISRQIQMIQLANES